MLSPGYHSRVKLQMTSDDDTERQLIRHALDTYPLTGIEDPPDVDSPVSDVPFHQDCVKGA